MALRSIGRSSSNNEFGSAITNSLSSECVGLRGSRIQESVKSLPASEHAIPQLLLASEAESPGLTLSLGRLQAGIAESSKRPQAASGEANDSRFNADRSNDKSQVQFVVLPQLAIQCFGKIC